MSVAERRCYSGKNRQAIISMTDSTRENREERTELLVYTPTKKTSCVTLGRVLSAW